MLNREHLARLEGYVIQTLRYDRHSGAEAWQDFSGSPYPTRVSARSARRRLAEQYPPASRWRIVRRAIVVTDTPLGE